MGKHSNSDTPFDQNLHLLLIIWSVCQTPSTHLHTKTHTQTNTQRHLALKSNKHYQNFIDCLTKKMKCYSTTSNTFGTKTGLLSVYWIFSPSFNSLITSFATSIVFAQQIVFMSFPKAKLWEDDALHLIYRKLAFLQKRSRPGKK